MFATVARMMRWWAALLPVLWLGGCGDDGGGDDDDEVPDAAAVDASAPDAASPGPCVPTGGGPYWIEELESLELTLRCSTGSPVPPEAFSLEPLPEGADWDAATATLRWTPGLDQASVFHLGIAVEGSSERGEVIVGVADRWADRDNVPVVDPAAYTHEYGLPVVHIDAGAIDDVASVPATVTYLGHAYAAQAKLRGATSIYFPKNSYTLEFPREDRFDDPGRGFEQRNKMVLVTTFNDNAYLRQRLCYALWNRLDPEHLQIHTAMVVVFLRGEYHGLYTLVDHVNRHLLERGGLREESNLYFGINHAANFRRTDDDGLPKLTLHDGYEKKEGTPLEGEPGAFDDLEELVGFVADSTPAEFAAGLDARVDRRDFVDWWIFVTFVTNWDSLGKNAYLAHDPAGGLWRYAPWDFNQSFGQDYITYRAGYRERPAVMAEWNELMTKLLADPVLGEEARQRYEEALGGTFSADAVLALVDELAAAQDASARRDEARWEWDYRHYWNWGDRRDFTSYDEEVEYVRGWVADRVAFLQDDLGR